MKRLLMLAVAALIVAAVALGMQSYQRQQAKERRFADWAAWQEREQFAASALNRRLKLEAEWISLRELANEIERQCNIPVSLNEHGLRAEKWDPDRKFLVPVGTLSLQTLFHFILDEDLTPDFYADRMVITTVEASRDHNLMRTVVYPLPQPDPRGMDEDAWADLIRINFDDSGNRWFSGDADVAAVPGGLIVIHSEHGHRQVKWLIESLARAQEGHLPNLLWPPTTQSSRREQITTALQETTSCDFTAMPLAEVAQSLAQQHHIPILLHARKLEEASVLPRSPITKSLHNISLKSALNLILKDLDLTFVITDDAILITTQEDAESRLTVMAYDVDDLLWKDAVNPFDADWDPFENLLLTFMRPTSWGDYAGPGPTLGHGDRWLVFPQTRAVHEEVGELLNQLRRALASEDQKHKFPLSRNERAELAIEEALDRVIEFDDQSQSLEDATAEMATKLGIPIVLSSKWLEEASVSLTAPVSMTLGTAPARDHLQALLGLLQLEYIIRDEVLNLTTPEDAESHLLTRVYDTRDFIQSFVQEEPFCNSIRNAVEPRSWSPSSGIGVMDVYMRLLIVSQTSRAHQQIEKLLSSWRFSKVKENISPLPINSP